MEEAAGLERTQEQHRVCCFSAGHGSLLDICFILCMTTRFKLAVATVILAIAHIDDVAARLHSLFVNLAF